MEVTQNKQQANLNLNQADQTRLQENMQGDVSWKQEQSQQNQAEFANIVNPLYPRVLENEADAIAWVFESPDTINKYFFKLPALNIKDVRVRVIYSAICQTDIEKGRSKSQDIRYPFCGGHEVVGEVVAIGSEVSRVKIGDKVLLGPVRDACMNCDMCKQGETSLCTVLPKEEKQNIAGKYFGGFATHFQQPESHIFKLHANLNIETAAPLMCAGITVYRPLAKYGKKNWVVGMIGIGGLGHLAIQFARAMGMSVDALINKHDLEKYHDILGLGVEKIVEWDDDRQMQLVQNRYEMLLYMLPVALPVDEMNKITLALKPMGRIIIIGVPPKDQKLEVSYMPLILHDIQLIGTMCGGRDDTQAMLNFAESNKIESLCEFFEFEDFQKAIDHVENGHPRFRAVLRVDQVSRRFVH